MSLTEDITALVSRATALIDTFNGKKAQIDAAVAGAVAAVPAMTRIVHVDQTLGDDAGDGGTATPVRSLGRALALIGAGRSGEIRLLSNYAFETARVMLPVNANVYVRSWGGARRTLTLPVLPSTDGGTSYQQEVAGFFCPAYGLNSLTFDDLTIVFPAAPVTGGVLAPARYSALVGSNQGVGPALVAAEYKSVEFVRPADGVGAVMGCDLRAVSLMVKFATYDAARMAGNWVSGVAAGASPSATNWLITNLSTM